MSIQLFKDGDNMAIRTDCLNEDEFNRQFSGLLDGLISDGWHVGDWEFQFNYWLPQYVDICCSYRGYKSEVDKRTVLLAGSRMISSKPTHEIDTSGTVFNDGTKVDGKLLNDIMNDNPPLEPETDMVKKSIKNAKKVNKADPEPVGIK